MGCSSSREFLVEMKSFHEKYHLQQILGKGAFAQVRLAQCSETNKDFAVKILELRGKEQGESHAGRPSGERLRQEFSAEARAWSHVGSHPNIVGLHESFHDTYFGYFVMEKCTRSFLEGLRSEPELNELTYSRYFQEMLLSLAHIHAAGVIHRDIKQDNFLLGGSTGLQVKLCDFGLSVIVPADGKLYGVYGTAPYMAPEMVLKDMSHGEPSDMWSLGVIAYTAFFGGFPYNPKEKNSEAMKKVIREGVPEPAFQPSRKFKQDPVSDQAMEFVMALLNRNQSKRPSATAALKMDYIAKAEMFKARASSLTSLQPMLHGAVRAGAFSTRPPQVDPNTDQILDDLQARGKQVRIGGMKTATPLRSPTPSSDGGPTFPDEEGFNKPQQSPSKRLGAGSKPSKMAWESASTKAGSSSSDRAESRSNSTSMDRAVNA